MAAIEPPLARSSKYSYIEGGICVTRGEHGRY